MIPTVLVVDDDDAFRELVLDILATEGYRLLAARSAEEALDVVAREDRVDVVLTDQRMPGLSGLDLVRRLGASAEPPAFLLMTAYGTIPQAVEAMRLGVADYVTKPLESPMALRSQVRKLLAAEAPRAAEGDFLTRDAAMLEVLALADRAAATDATVLVIGESGTGKELLARRIHQESSRSGGPFVAVNSAALPESLAESELFGHEKGAFTGAVGRHRGRFEQAHGGTLFLDEIGELQEPVQAKLLRVLEEREVERVGGERRTPIDIRLVAATHRDLARAAAEGRFRSDLYYRLNVVTLEIPPLRQRPADVELLTGKLIEHLASRLGVDAKPVSAEAMARLRSHPWPGNVRELRNALERALIAATGEEIRPTDLPSLGNVPVPAAEAPAPADASGPLSLKERERRTILDALEQTGGHRENAARLLGISVRTLYNRLKEYGIR